MPIIKRKPQNSSLHKSSPPDKLKEHSGKQLFFLVVVSILIITYWFLFPKWRDIPGGLLTSVSLILAEVSFIVKNIGDIVDGWDKIKKQFGIDVNRSDHSTRERYALWKKVGTFPLAISLGAVIIGGIIFLAAFRNTPLTGKAVPNESFLNNYGIMYMGDTGDIQFSKLPSGLGFVYETNGKGPHQWEYKYLNGKENPSPAQFAGIMLVDGDGGNKANDGYDLRGYKEISWKACAEGGSDFNEDGNVVVEFVAGGIDWRINDTAMKKEPVPFPDSLPRQTLGIYSLRKCPETEVISFSLSKMRPGYLQKVIGGFGWVISWAPNGVAQNSDGTGPEKAKTFKIIISDVRYIKDNSIGALLGRNLEVFFSILFGLTLLGFAVKTFVSQTKLKQSTVSDK
jgi:hypothetical protein